jgi:hypothetical protein
VLVMVAAGVAALWAEIFHGVLTGVMSPP